MYKPNHGPLPWTPTQTPCTPIVCHLETERAVFKPHRHKEEGKVANEWSIPQTYDWKENRSRVIRTSSLVALVCALDSISTKLSV